MIAYVDSSVLARAYLGDEDGSAEARHLIANASIGLATGPLTRIEVTGAIVRAARSGRRVAQADALARLDADLEDSGRFVVLTAPLEDVEAKALEIVRAHGLRTLDALHVALASIALPPLADRGEPLGFASRDGDQATVAESLGFARI